MTQYLRKASTADELPGAIGADCPGDPVSRLRPAEWTIYALALPIHPLPRADPVSAGNCDTGREPGRSDARRPAVGVDDPAGLSSFRGWSAGMPGI